MKILSKDYGKGYCNVLVEDSEDLWLLNLIIGKGDTIKGTAERKIKMGSSEEKSKSVRKKVSVSINVEGVEFSPVKNELRINGRIKEAPDFIPKGDYQTISVSLGSTIRIEKEWSHYEINRLESAVSERRTSILAVLFDRQEALFFLLKGREVKELLKLKGNVKKKAVETNVKENEFYKDIVKNIRNYLERTGAERVVCASPAFWKDYLKREMDDVLRKKAVFSTISSIDKTSITELMRRPELSAVLKHVKAGEEAEILEKVLKALSSDRLAYSLEDVKLAVIQGNISSLITTDSAIAKFKEKGLFGDVEDVLKTVERVNGKVIIFSTKEASERIDELGGIVAIKRWNRQ